MLQGTTMQFWVTFFSVRLLFTLLSIIQILSANNKLRHHSCHKIQTVQINLRFIYVILVFLTFRLTQN